jgi:hypothetical protein
MGYRKYIIGILILGALGYYHTQIVQLRNWNKTLKVVIHPITSPVSAMFTQESLITLSTFLHNQAKFYTGHALPDLDITVTAPFNGTVPKKWKTQNTFLTPLNDWIYNLWILYWTYPHIRYGALMEKPTLHLFIDDDTSTSSSTGPIGLVHASTDPQWQERNLVLVIYELLRTLGASSQYKDPLIPYSLNSYTISPETARELGWSP